MNEEIKQDLIEFIVSKQEDSGYFPTYLYSSVKPEREWFYIPNSPFILANILLTLTPYAQEESIHKIISKGCNFLNAQKDGSGLWRFWPFDFELPSVIFDTDDSAISSAILSKNGYELNNRELFEYSKDSEGYYKTWFVPTIPLFFKNFALWWKLLKDYLKSWKTIFLFRFLHPADKEPSVAANVLLYLGQNETTINCIEKVIEEVKSEDPTLKYYGHKEVLFYHIARAYEGGVIRFEELREYFQSYFEKKSNANDFENILMRAMAINTMIIYNLSRILIDKEFNILLQEIAEEKHKNIYPYFVGGYKRIAMFGSQAFTATMVLKSVFLYNQISE